MWLGVSGLMGSITELNCADPWSVSGRARSNFSFQLWYCKLSVKNQWGRDSWNTVQLKFFTLVCRDIAIPPYDHSITCSAHHLRRVNSNSLQNFHSFNRCHSQYSHHKDVLWPALPLVPNPSNDFNIPLQLRIPCTQSYHAPTFKTPLSLPSSSHPWALHDSW